MLDLIKSLEEYNFRKGKELTEDQLTKVVMVGDEGIGKTSLLTTFLTRAYKKEHIPTVVENYYGDIIIKNTEVALNIWDTAGQENLDRIRTTIYGRTDVLLISFAIDDFASLNNVEDKWDTEWCLFLNNVPKFLVGTRGDLRQQEGENSEEIIPEKDCREVAKRIGAVDYIECSVSDLTSIRHLFKRATTVALKAHRRFISRSCNMN